MDLLDCDQFSETNFVREHHPYSSHEFVCTRGVWLTA